MMCPDDAHWAPGGRDRVADACVSGPLACALFWYLDKKGGGSHSYTPEIPGVQFTGPGARHPGFESSLCLLLTGRP